jgi:hypothetical protein
MVYRGPGFLAFASFGSSPPPSSPVIKLSLFLSLPVLYVAGRAYGRERAGGAMGEETNHSTAGPLQSIQYSLSNTFLHQPIYKSLRGHIFDMTT